MSWIRLDDQFTRQRAWHGVSLAARWHYLALIEECERSGAFDGRLPLAVARRASDVRRPTDSLRELEVASLIVVEADSIVVNNVEAHLMTPSMRVKKQKDAARKARWRAHSLYDDHRLCDPATCDKASPRSESPADKDADSHAESPRDVTGYPVPTRSRRAGKGRRAAAPGSAHAPPSAASKDDEVRKAIRTILAHDPKTTARDIEQAVRAQGIRIKTARVRALTREARTGQPAVRPPAKERPRPEPKPCATHNQPGCQACRDISAWLTEELKQQQIDQAARRHAASRQRATGDTHETGPW